MSVSTKYGLYAVNAGGTVLGGITRQSISTGSVVQGEPTSGTAHKYVQMLMRQQPTASFSTLSLATALGAVGESAANIGDMSGGLILYEQKHADGATRASGANHRTVTINKGIIAPQNLSASHADNASLGYQAWAVYNGSNDPLVLGESQSLPSLTGAGDSERYGLGTVNVGGVSIDQIRGITINFGLQVTTEGADGDYWDTFSSVESVAASIQLNGINAEWFKSSVIPLIGKAATHANSYIYLRRRENDGTYVANGTSQHIKFTFSGLAVMESVFDASGNSAGSTSVNIPLHHDGTYNPLVVTLNTAIS